MRKPVRLQTVSLVLAIVMGQSGMNIGSAATCARITTFADGRLPLRELHVRTTGNDSSGDGSAAKPFATIQKAISKATAGTAVRIHSGVYSGNNIAANLSGTAAAPIWIGGAPNEAKPIIHGGTVGFYLSKMKYLVLHDMSIQYTSAHGINLDDGGETANLSATRSIIFRNLNIHDTSGHCLKLAGVNDFRILNSQFVRCTGVNIDGVGCHDGLISGSTITNGQYGVAMKGGSYNVEIRGNLFRQFTLRALLLGGNTGMTFFRPPLNAAATNYEARDIRAIANIIQDSVSPAAIVGCYACPVLNNTIINPSTFVFRILQETVSNAAYRFGPSSYGLFQNNIIYFNSAAIRIFVNVGTNTAPTTFRFTNNLWYAYNNPALSVPTGLPVVEYNSIYGKNPLFMNPGTGLFPILATSPAADRGVLISSAERLSAGDYTGSCWGSPPSIGAFEAAIGTIAAPPAPSPY